MTTETDYNDADLLRAHNATATPCEFPEEAETATAFSPAVMAAYRKTRKSREANDARSRRIVAECRRGRGEPAPAPSGQTAIFDFGGDR